MKESQKILLQHKLDELVRDLTKVGTKPKSLVRRNLEEFAGMAAAYAETETMKAFGGCTLCYGKGYSTTNMRTDGFMKIRFCSCGRGVQLSAIFATLE